MQQSGTKSGIDQTELRDKGKISGLIYANLQAGSKTVVYQLQFQKSNKSMEGENIGPDNLIVLDPKRRRVDLDHSNVNSKAQDQSIDMETRVEDIQMSKNGLPAGVAAQPRLSL